MNSEENNSEENNDEENGEKAPELTSEELDTICGPLPEWCAS